MEMNEYGILRSCLLSYFVKENNNFPNQQPAHDSTVARKFCILIAVMVDTDSDHSLILFNAAVQ